MEKVIVVISIVVSIVVTVVAYINFKKYKKVEKQYKKLEADHSILTEDNEKFVSRSLFEDDVISKLCKEMYQILDKFKNSSNNSEFLKYEISLRELCNNIEVIADEETLCNNALLNINDTLKKLKHKKVVFEVADNIPHNLIFDEVKFLSALNLIIKKSVSNNIKDKIKISIEMLEKKNCNIKLKINVENIKLSNKNYQVINKIFRSHLIDNIDDPDLLIIRANLFCLKSKASISSRKGVDFMTIEMPMTKQKEIRKKPRALIVDDNKQIAIMNQEVIKEIGFDADVVFKPEECLKKVKNNMDDYDIVITDNQMPNMNGTDLIRKFKNIEGFNLPVVIVTGDKDEDNDFLDYYGFDGYIQKPLTKDKAIDVIKKLIQD